LLLSEQRLVSVEKCIAERGLAFSLEMRKTLDCPESFPSDFESFKQMFKKEDAMLLATGFPTVSQIANHCQIPCYIIKFYYS